MPQDHVDPQGSPQTEMAGPQTGPVLTRGSLEGVLLYLPHVFGASLNRTYFSHPSCLCPSRRQVLKLGEVEERVRMKEEGEGAKGIRKME